MRHEEFMKKQMDSPQMNSWKNWANSVPSQESKVDNVNKPPHYNQAGVECIEAIQAATDNGFEYYLQGNIIKYLWRYRYKNGVEDLKKAQWYLTKLIETKGE
jgi:predicted alternative tryptophan synthase beta-subunit|tara:strand:+ start:177 stop:482 length:306 start_codon:yes stop_codon:yes gene_type:complete